MCYIIILLLALIIVGAIFKESDHPSWIDAKHKILAIHLNANIANRKRIEAEEVLKEAIELVEKLSVEKETKLEVILLLTKIKEKLSDMGYWIDPYSIKRFLDKYKKTKIIKTELPHGVVYHNEHGQLYNENDEPAIILKDGSKLWFKNGRLHRDGDEPAVIGYDGVKKWYKNGVLHRGGGKPAVIWADGSEEYWINGEPAASTRKTNIFKTELAYRVEYRNEKGELHNENDEPATISKDGTKYWYKNGLLHRDGDKPAITWVDGREEYWVNGECIKTIRKG